MADLSSFKHRKSILMITAVIFLIFFAYWLYQSRYVSTDDAYINAHVVQISPRVSGQVSHLHVIENQFVHKGDILFTIDPLPYQLAVKEAEAQYNRDNAQLSIAQITAKRTIALVGRKVAAAQEGDVASATLQSAEAALALAKANLDKAELNVSYTNITAPADGWISNLTLREGDQITQNQPLFALIDHQQFWVDANFKETHIEKIHPGQKVVIKVDMYPNHPFAGVVQSISGGSGNAFSLLPAQNATGNWVKVTQRVPVRIIVTATDPAYPLKIGTSANVDIKIS